MNVVRGEADFSSLFASIVYDHVLIHTTYCLGFLTHYYLGVTARILFYLLLLFYSTMDY